MGDYLMTGSTPTLVGFPESRIYFAMLKERMHASFHSMVVLKPETYARRLLRTHDGWGDLPKMRS